MTNFEVSIPWGSTAVNEVANGIELEMLLLQQSIIDGQQQELIEAKVMPTTPSFDTGMIQKIAQLEIKLQATERDRETTFAALIDVQAELETINAAGAENVAELKAEILALQSQLAISEQTKKVVLDSNYELERKAANKAYQHQVLQTQFDVNREAYNKIHTDHQALIGSHSVLVQTEKNNQKLIKQLTSEVDGFDLRLENVRKTEHARVIESLPPAPATVSVISDEVEPLKQEVAQLKEKLSLCNAQKSEMNNATMKAQAEAERFKKEAKRLVDHAHQSNDLVGKAVGEMNAQTDIAARLDNAMQKTIVEFSQQTIQLDTIKRENAYLSEMLDYQEMRTIWTHEDGTAAYIISCNPSRALSLNDGEKERQSMIHPVCWVMNTNGTGHIVLLNEAQDELLFPSAAKGKCALNIEHKDSLKDAIKAVTIEKFNDALKKAVRRAQNICNAADVLDINWSEPLNIDRLLGKIMEDELQKADILEARKSASVITRLAEMHRRGLNPKVNTRNSANKTNKRKRK
ncbi:hypothetical protein VXS06_14800 [Photobacterium toruni]|uniref:Chromosome partition protein Smc n=1 Tax=Photobacterium toruni TaxID=1935446 RepID=A0ABU6LBM5_9GAMM|nr:hypothetical protein [Photobacterium toruni]